MTSNWSAKQKSATLKDDRVLNRLENKRPDFSIVEEKDREKTFHVSLEKRKIN